MAGGTPAFPASRVLGAQASRSHDSRNALLGNAASRHARQKPTPFSSPSPTRWKCRVQYPTMAESRFVAMDARIEEHQ